MIGQSFAPLGDPNQQRPGSPGGSPDGAQQAIQVLNYRMPRFGANAQTPAPPALLNGAGSAGLPSQGPNPIIQAILQAVLGHFTPQQQSAPSAMGGMGSGQGPMIDNPPSPLPTPKVNYQPPPGGTAGPNPGERDRNTPMPGGKMNGFFRG